MSLYICVYIYIYIYIYVHMYVTNIFFLLIFKVIKWKITVNLTHFNFPHSSVGEEFACNAKDPGLIPVLGSSAGEGTGYPLQYSGASLVAQLVKNNCNEGDLGSIPRLGRSPREGKGYPPQYSDLENSMDSIVHGVKKSQTQQSYFHFHLSTHSKDNAILKD